MDRPRLTPTGVSNTSINTIGWGSYLGFVALAVYLNWYPGLHAFGGELGLLKLTFWGLWSVFLAYSLYCSTKENIFRTIPKLVEYYWGGQICMDLYLGLFVSMTLIYLNEGILAVAFWFLPTLLFANLSIFLYVGLHFDSLVATFAG